MRFEVLVHERTPFQSLHNKSQSICGSRGDRQEVQTQRYTSDEVQRVMCGIDVSEVDEVNPFGCQIELAAWAGTDLSYEY